MPIDKALNRTSPDIYNFNPAPIGNGEKEK